MRRFVALTASSALAAALALASPATVSAAWVWPVEGDVITPYRNGTNPYASGQHRGIDIAAALGTPVTAAAGGDVRFAGTAGTSGLTISIRTGDGYDTSYLHLSSLAVRAGAQVSVGDRIGAVGTTGTRSATAPHLHFGVRDAGSRHGYHDPLAFLPPPSATREPSPPTPAPAPEPEPAAPELTPAPVPTGTPHHASEPGPQGTALPLSEQVIGGAPAKQRAEAPRMAAHASPGLGSVPEPKAARRSLPRREPRAFAAPRRAPEKATGSSHIGHLDPDPLPAIEGEPSWTSADSEPTGPDIGWALACGGLLLAAAILGLTGDNRRIRSRSGLAAMLRPLVGRR